MRSRIGKPSVTEKELEGKNRLLFCLVHDVIAQDWITAQKRKHMAAVIQGSKVAIIWKRKRVRRIPKPVTDGKAES